jgi:membrane fusion protein, multidrug efflux system
MKKLPAKFLIIFALLAILLIVGVSLARRNQREAREAAEPQPIRVETITVTQQTIPDEVWASGTVQPFEQASLAPKIMSTVSAVYVREGDRVGAGQVLMRLEAKDLAAQAAAAGAGVTSAQAMNEKAQAGVGLQAAQTKANIAAAESARQQAEAQFRNADTELARMNRLYEQGVIAKQKLDNVTTSYDVAKAQLSSAQQQAETARIAAVQDRMAKKEAQAAAAMTSQAQANAGLSRVMLGYATLVAPFSGVVTARYVDPGDPVAPGMPALVVEDASSFHLEAAVAADNLAALHPGMSVGLELGADKRTGTGKVIRVTPAVDAGARKATVKVEIPEALHPVSGDFGRISFPVGYSQGILLPESALHDQGGIINVYIAGTNRRTDMRIVRVGRKINGQVEILTGLQPGDKVIVAASAPLADDLPIEAEEGRS